MNSIKEISKNLKMPSYCISAKTGEGVYDMFVKIIDHVIEYQNKQRVHQVIEQKKEEEETNVKINIDNRIKLDQEIEREIVVEKGCC